MSDKDLRERVLVAIRRGLDNLAALQTEAGSWNGDYGGSVFLLPMYVALYRVTGREMPERRRKGIVDYFFNVQNKDGSLGLHSEGEGCMMSTATGYAALRYLGVPRSEEKLQRMRDWVLGNGTALGSAQWGKFILAVQNLYDWEGLYPLPPELWLLPRSLPFHPGRFWCHTRVVYLPMSWLYGTRSQIEPDALCHELREDLYDRPYSQIRFEDHRDTVAKSDLYRPVTRLMKGVYQCLLMFERAHSKALRRLALDEVMRHITYEDCTTSHINLGPVNAVLNRMCHHFRDPSGEALRQAWDPIDEYLWEGHDGIKMNGYISTELWDTVFAMQAFWASPFASEYQDTLSRAYAFVRDSQILADTPERERYYRDPSRGGWPFANRPHGWPVTDCTSEGLQIAIEGEKQYESPVPEERMRDAVRLILHFQNDDGGFASYERRRGGKWLELLNPSQIFGDIMTDYSHVECTAACIRGLVAAKRRFSGEFDQAIDVAVRRAEEFLRASQRPDGSFEGFWGVCFTYGTFFGVSGLIAAGAREDDPAIEKAVRFLLEHQRPDGSFGEHYSSCTERRYVHHKEGQVVMTSWALLTLVRANRAHLEAARRAVEFILSRQAPDGGWPREAIAGVFNRTCMINYDNYRHYFPVLALSEYLGRVKACNDEQPAV